MATNADLKLALKIVEAAKYGDLRMLKKAEKRLLKNKRGEITETIYRVADREGNGAIHHAAFRGKTDMCEYLVTKFNIDVNMPGESGRTPLSFAANGGNVSTIEYLLNHGANLSVKDEDGFTPLHDAIFGANPESLRVLLSRGAPIEAHSVAGMPLLYASLQGFTPCMKVLLDHNANPNELFCDVITPLVITVMNNEECLFHPKDETKERVELLIKAGADVNKLPVLCLAYHSKELMDYLLESGADPNLPNESGRLPIEIAAMRGKKEIVETLFPLTTPIPTVPDWSVEGLFNYVESEEFKNEREVLSKKRVEHLKKRIADALYQQKEYLAALVLCTYALEEDRNDKSVYAKRAFCWLLLGNKLHDTRYKVNSVLDEEEYEYLAIPPSLGNT